MGRIQLLLIMCSLAVCCQAQTQQGVVKTKGRMVNGKHVKGTALTGAVVSVKGQNAVAVKNTDGSFSFPTVNRSFFIQSVTKNGYQLVDADAAPKGYAYSTNPLILLLETPSQQSEDRLTAERKIRRTLQQQLQQREDELEELKAQNKLTQEEYQKRLQQLYDDQKNNEKLIAEMAKEYSQMDFDQLDELNRQISDAILNGELLRADSLLRSKGDMQSRNAEITRRQQAETQEEADLAQRSTNLATSKEGTRKLLEDFAADCYKYHNMFKLENRHDSAAYYIELRAQRDTTNADWQFDAASYFHTQNQHNQAELYYVRALEILRRLTTSNSQTYEPYMAKVLNNLANILSDMKRFPESEAMHKEALEIRRRQSISDPQTYEPYLAGTLNNLALLYAQTQQSDKAVMMYQEALSIYQRLATKDALKYEPNVALMHNNLAILYTNMERYEDAETMYKDALEIRQRLSASDPQTYEVDVSITLNNLAGLYWSRNRTDEAETAYKEALEIRRRLTEANPQANEPSLALLLNNMGGLYRDTRRFEEAEIKYQEALSIRRRLAETNPLAFTYSLSRSLGSISFLYNFKKEFQKAEKYARESISLNPSLHIFISSLAASLLFQGKYAEAETLYRQYKDELKDSFLDDLKLFTEAGVIPEERKEDVERIKRMLSLKNG